MRQSTSRRNGERPGAPFLGLNHSRNDLMRYRRELFDDNYARLRGDRPCKTIAAHLAKDGNCYIHPTQVRSVAPHQAA
jgi:DNA (cytosine-5)-methyltransferase 1